MSLQSLDLPDERATESAARGLAKALVPGMVLTFVGEIGSGKTSLVRAMLRHLGVTGAIKSPSFSIVETYDCQDFTVNHFDLYRIEEEAELAYIGFREYFVPNAVCCIEWPERAPYSLPQVDIRCCLSIKGSGRLLLIETLDIHRHLGAVNISLA